MQELQKMSHNFFEDMIKGVVDTEKRILAIDAELHADLEAFLLSAGSRQEDLWGINLYPYLAGDDFLEFDSMINIKPSQNNRSKSVESLEIQRRIREIINQTVSNDAT